MLRSEPTPAEERYLEAIYILASEGHPVMASRVAARLGHALPTVTQALRRLAERGWVQIGQSRAIALTPVGRQLAANIMRRHRVIERWLVDSLGMSWASAHSEASRMEHAISHEVVDRLYRALGCPSTCPHGNPIPGADGLPPYQGTTTLDRLPAGSQGRVVRIAEDAEEDVQMLALLERAGLVPGSRFRVQKPGQVETSKGLQSVPTMVASKVWVDSVSEQGA